MTFRLVQRLFCRKVIGYNYLKCNVHRRYRNHAHHFGGNNGVDERLVQIVHGSP